MENEATGGGEQNEQIPRSVDFHTYSCTQASGKISPEGVQKDAGTVSQWGGPDGLWPSASGTSASPLGSNTTTDRTL